MFESKCVITPALKQRFCKDAGLNIKIFEEPLFSNMLSLYDAQFGAIEKYRKFIALVDKLGGEGEYFRAYEAVKDAAITYLNENEDMMYFSREEDMSKFECQNKNFKSTDIYINPNVGRVFLSIDMKKGNFTSLRHYNSKIVDNCSTYEEFLGKFTEEEYFKNSKYIRQVIFGNVNPRRQTTYEKYLMDTVLTKLLEFVDKDAIAFFATDEIVVDLTDRYADKSGVINLDFWCKVQNLVKDMVEQGINIRAEAFILGKISETSGFVKKFIFGDKKYDLKCVDYLTMPFVLRFLNNEEPKEEDSVFVYEGRKAKLLDIPKIDIVYHV